MRLIGAMQLICNGYEEGVNYVSVRRIAATLLLLTFSIALITPVLSASDPESKFAPCCRRNGKHHCVMTGLESEPSSVPTLQAPRCASYPAATVFAANPLVSLPPISMAGIAAPLYHPAVRPQAQSLWRGSFSRTRQKRGPPLVS
jgi:hypothetical protein